MEASPAEKVSSQAAVALKGLSKQYRLYHSPMDRLKEALHPFGKKYSFDFFALRDVNFTIGQGETWGIIGLNGSGKSTLLKIICGVLQPSSGQALVNGRISALLELGSGFNPEFTGRQNVFFAGALAGIERPEMNQRFEKIVSFADIGDFLDQPVKTYSSGMVLRLAFSVAIHVSPDILVIDEALAVGDVRFRHKCMARIRSYQGNSTILFVSHDLNAVVTLCDHVVWLHEGRIRCIGPPAEVIKDFTKANYEGMEEEEEGENPAPITEQTPPPPPAGCDAFGQEGALITGVQLRSFDRGVVDTMTGKEPVELEMKISARTFLASPIVGLQVTNNLGVQIFGYNNLMIDKTFGPLQEDAEVMVRFRFMWPDLSGGSYGITVAVADGSLDEHVQHHFIHDALIIKVVKNFRIQGMMAVEDPSFEVMPI